MDGWLKVRIYCALNNFFWEELSTHISNTNIWKVSFPIYACCIRRGGTKKFHQTPRAINFPSIPWWAHCSAVLCSWQPSTLCFHCTCWKKAGHIQNAQIGVGARVHPVGQYSKTDKDGGSGGGVRHNRWLGKTLNPGRCWSVPPYLG